MFPPVEPPDPDVSTAQTVHKGHGRIQVRTVHSRPLRSRWIESWGLVNAKQVIRIERVRRSQRVETREVEYYLTSLATTRATAFDLMRWIRAHWRIESQWHHVRDGTCDEDHCRVRKGASAQVLAALRNAAIHLLAGVDALSVRAATQRLQIHPEEALDLLNSTPV